MDAAHAATNSAQSRCAALDALLEEILVDAYGEDEQLWAFRQAIEDEVSLPVDAFVLGEPVSVVGIDYDGNDRRGLTARCRRDRGEEHVVSLADVRVAGQGKAMQYVAAYRKWLGLEALPPQERGSSSPLKAHKAEDGDIRLDGPVELVVLSVKERAARCRLVSSGRILTLRAGRLWTIVRARSFRSVHASSGATQAIPICQGTSKVRASTLRASASCRFAWTSTASGTRPTSTGARVR